MSKLHAFLFTFAALAAQPVTQSSAQGTCDLARIQRQLPGEGTFAGALAAEGPYLLAQYSIPDQSSVPAHGVLLYERELGGWTELGLLASVAGNPGDIEAAGGQALLGALIPEGLFGENQVLVYELDGEGNPLVQVLSDPDLQTQSGFGTAIAVEGNRLAIGAPGYVGVEGESGAIYCYAREEGDWVLQQRLTSNDARVRSLGASVDLSEFRLVAGAPDSVVDGLVGAGRALAYDFASGVWVQQGSFISSQPETDGRFGHSVGALISRLFVGAPGEFGDDNENGVVRIYVRNGANWELEGELHIPPHFANQGSYGEALDVEERTLAVGAPRWLSSDGLSGRIFLYRRNGTDWSPAGSVEPVTGAPFGNACVGGSVHLENGVVYGGPGCITPTAAGSYGELYVQGIEDDYRDVGLGIAGVNGPLNLDGVGCAIAGYDARVDVGGGAPQSLGLLLGSFQFDPSLGFPVQPSVLPPYVVQQVFVTDPFGGASFEFALPLGLRGMQFHLQAGVLDTVTPIPSAFSLSETLRVSIR